MFGRKAQTTLSPAMIMSIVISLIILAVGVYAFFTTTDMIAPTAPWSGATGHSSARYNMTYYGVANATSIGNQVFNVIGVVLVIGAIMLIVTMVYSYMRP